MSFVGHVAIEHLLDGGMSPEEVNHLWTELAAELSLKDLFVVKEYGTENGHAHFHYYLETPKSKSTVHSKLKAKFTKAGVQNPGQHVSCKPASEEKLPDYFKYLCKGPHGKPMSKPLLLLDWVIFDMTKSRMVAELHDAFHAKAKEIREQSRKRKAGEAPVMWYQKLADECIASGSRDRESVMQVVSRYYVYESKKGFDKFAVVRTFWAVFSLVNGSSAHSDLLEQCLSLVRP